MQLNRHRTHASTTTITTSESSGSGSRKGRGENIKKAGEGVALSAAGTLHHRLPLWKGGREVDGGKGGAPWSSTLSVTAGLFLVPAKVQI